MPMAVESAQLMRILTFNQVGLKIQEAMSVDDILHSIGEGFKEIGLICIILLLDEEQKNLKIEYTSIDPSIVKKMEKIIGMNAVGFEIPLKDELIYTTVIKEKRAIFDNRRAEILKKMFSTSFDPLLDKIVSMLNLSTGIITPLIFKGEVIGVMDVLSPDLAEEDIPTVVAFANQAAIAIDNARLLSKTEAESKERRETEDKYRQLLEDMNDGYAVIQDGKVVFANTRYCEIFGYDLAQILGKPFNQVIVPDDRLEVMDGYKKSMRGKKAIVDQYEGLGIKKDGTKITIEASIKPIQYESKPAFSAIVRDITERKRAEKALRDSEHHHRVLMETASNFGEGIIIAHDFEGNRGVIAFVNDAVTKILGYSREELLQKKMRDFVTTASTQQIEDKYMKRQAGDKTEEHYETTALAKDGTEVPLEVQTDNTTYQGKPAIVVFIRDITQRKLMESQLREYSKSLERMVEDGTQELRIAEERYRSVVQHSGLAMGIFDYKEGVLQLLNKEAERMFGYTTEELMHEKISVVIPEDLLEEAKWLNREVREKGYVDDYKTERLRKDGTRFPVEMSIASLKDEEGNLIGGSFIARDITEQKMLEREKEKVQAELARSEERYRSVFEHAGLAMGVYDQKGTIHLLNKEAEKMFGYTAEGLIGIKASEIMVIPEDLIEEAKWIRREAKEKGYVDSFETERLRKDGTRFPVELTFTALKDSEGNITGFSFIGRDITERKRLEQEKEEAQQQLMTSERLSAIGELASIVGHELRNPLAVIGNSVYYLKMKLGDSDEKVNKHLGILEGEVAISSRIISNILDFARPKQPVFQDIHINSVIEQALEKYTLPDDVNVFTKMGRNLPQIAADAEQLRQVFVNMISNAAQAMPEGGKLLIRTTLSDDLIKVEFKDTGVGISPENLDKILQPMFSTKVKGVGLGLTISKKIIENHHGKIEVTSQVDQGTTFTITLPVGGKDER